MSQTFSKDTYLTSIVRRVPRLLSQLDRNSCSKTYGCFDREYWHYKTATIPSARKQEAVLSLALLYKTKNNLNPYYKNEKLKVHIESALQYWIHIQERNGSFNEWYTKENSFVATSFSLYAVTETLLLLGKAISPDVQKQTLESVRKAALFLVDKYENKAQNQETGSIIALYNCYLLTKNKAFKKAAAHKTKRFKTLQKDEGWFMEYGGADIGYLSLTVDYLSKYHIKSKDTNAMHIIKKAALFLQNFIHPDMTAGGLYGSRNTSYIIPSGIEYLASIQPDVQLLRAFCRKAHTTKMSFGPVTLDDRYLLYNGYCWIQAYVLGDSKEISSSIIDEYFAKKRDLTFPEAGLQIHNTNNSFCITNYRKGGSYIYYDKRKKRTIVDPGVSLITDAGETLTSSWLGSGNRVTTSEDHIIITKGYFRKSSTFKQTPIKYAILFIVQNMFGWSTKLSLYLKLVLRKLLIVSNISSNSQYTRSIDLKKRTVTDTIICKDHIKKIVIGGSFTYIYVPSSCFYNSADSNSPITEYTYYPKVNEYKLTFTRKLQTLKISVS